MTNFRFKLQPVHDLRQRRRDDAERALASAAAAVEAARERLAEATRARINVAAQYLALVESETFDPHALAMRAGFLARLSEAEAEARAAVTSAERACEAARLSAVEAAREAEATARLRDRRQNEHAELAARTQQAALDEHATLANARRENA
jgi:flagellar export protein FliJ